jgi:hypothetical protein
MKFVSQEERKVWLKGKTNNLIPYLWARAIMVHCKQAVIQIGRILLFHLERKEMYRQRLVLYPRVMQFSTAHPV